MWLVDTHTKSFLVNEILEIAFYQWVHVSISELENENSFEISNDYWLHTLLYDLYSMEFVAHIQTNDHRFTNFNKNRSYSYSGGEKTKNY